MPIQSLILCDTAEASASIPESGEFVHANFTGAFSCIVRAGATPFVQAVLHIVPHPFGRERFEFALMWMDAGQWKPVSAFHATAIEVDPTPMPYFRAVGLMLPLAEAGDYAIRILSAVESFDNPEFWFRFCATEPTRT